MSLELDASILHGFYEEYDNVQACWRYERPVREKRELFGGGTANMDITTSAFTPRYPCPQHSPRARRARIPALSVRRGHQGILSPLREEGLARGAAHWAAFPSEQVS